MDDAHDTAACPAVVWRGAIARGWNVIMYWRSEVTLRTVSEHGECVAQWMRVQQAYGSGERKRWLLMVQGAGNVPAQRACKQSSCRRAMQAARHNGTFKSHGL